ncbi:MAG: sugar-binding domain-containing protein, partial [Beijerinckiaceae bacterium]
PVGEDNPDVLIATLGQAAATFLKETVDITQIVGLAWTRVLPEIGAQLDSMTAKAVVQLCGAIPAGPAGLTSIDAVRDIARKADCPALMYYAPLVATDKAAAEGIRRQPDVLAAMDLIPNVSKAIIGIGAWDKQLSTVTASLSETEQTQIAAKGVVAEIAGSITLDAKGKFVRTELNDRVIGIQAEQLLAIPDRIGIAFGMRKLGAISAAMRGGYINSLITHSGVAELLIEAGVKCALEN